MSPVATTTQVGDLTRHTQSILERAQAYADAMRAETDQVLAAARAEAARIREEVQGLLHDAERQHADAVRDRDQAGRALAEATREAESLVEDATEQASMLTQSATRTSEEAVTSARAEARGPARRCARRGAEALRAERPDRLRHGHAAVCRARVPSATRPSPRASRRWMRTSPSATRRRRRATPPCSTRPPRRLRSSGRSAGRGGAHRWAPPAPHQQETAAAGCCAAASRRGPTPQERVDRAHAEAGEIMTQAEDHLKWGQDTVRRILDEGEAEVSRMRKETHRELAARMRSAPPADPDGPGPDRPPGPVRA